MRYDAGKTGLTGKVGYTLLRPDGTVYQARTSEGVVESPAGSGSYLAPDPPAAALPLDVVWDEGVGTRGASERIMAAALPAGFAVVTKDSLDVYGEPLGPCEDDDGNALFGVVIEAFLKDEGTHGQPRHATTSDADGTFALAVARAAVYLIRFALPRQGVVTREVEV